MDSKPVEEFNREKKRKVVAEKKEEKKKVSSNKRRKIGVVGSDAAPVESIRVSSGKSSEEKPKKKNKSQEIQDAPSNEALAAVEPLPEIGETSLPLTTPEEIKKSKGPRNRKESKIRTKGTDPVNSEPAINGRRFRRQQKNKARDTALSGDDNLDPPSNATMQESNGSVGQPQQEKEADKEGTDCPLEGHVGHAPDQCWETNPELKDALLEERKEKRRLKKLKNAEKYEQDQSRFKEGGKAEGQRKKTKKQLRRDREDRQVQELQPIQDEEEAKARHQIGPAEFSKRGDTWNMSKPAGGRFLAHDPVFSRDEKYLFLATLRGVHVYSTSTSLLVRTIEASPREEVAGYALSATNPSHLYIAMTEGTIVLCNWETGRELLVAPEKWPIRAIAVTQLHGTEHDTVFTVETENAYLPESRIDHIVVRQFPLGQTKITHQSLFWGAQRDLLFLKVVDGGNVIFAASGKGTVMGKVADDSSLTGLKYVWRSQVSSEPITCLDARARRRPSTRSEKSRKTKDMIYDLIVGGVHGTIFAYNDFLHKLEESEKPEAADSVITPNLLRWHRDAVGTVRWSLDGNYIISGGKETVLCLWQVDTSNVQTLPHLMAAIEHLTVSPSGTSYAVHLADNSVMVLSTTELEPRANIPSIQSHVVPRGRSLLPQVETVTTVTQDSVNPADAFVKTLATSNPLDSNQLLLAVPASQNQTERLNTAAPTPFLQTYDVFKGSHVTRQALTRNNATSRALGPEGNRIEEPTIAHLQISTDGFWMITVEEWTPPIADLDFIVSDHNDTVNQCQRRTETYLKFWRWDIVGNHWMLETRVDQPHQLPSGTHTNKILDVAADPMSAGFATLGEDNSVRIWKPKTRKEDGTVLRGVKQDGSVAWSCSRVIELEKVSTTEDGRESTNSIVMNGKVAYSNDGSILAAAVENSTSNEAAPIHFLDAALGAVKHSEVSMYSRYLAGMSFMGRYLVLLSEDLRVWDVVSNSLAWGIKLEMQMAGLSPQQRGMLSHLAINSTSNTFAVAIPPPIPFDFDDELHVDDLFSTVMIFEPERMGPVMSYNSRSPITALVPLSGSAGYIAIDSVAEYRILSPNSGAAFITSAIVSDPIKAEALEVVEVDDDVEMEEEEEIVAGDEINGAEEEELETEKYVVRPEELAGIFDRGPSFALPSVKELFDGVVGLYGRKANGVQVS